MLDLEIITVITQPNDKLQGYSLVHSPTICKKRGKFPIPVGDHRGVIVTKFGNNLTQVDVKSFKLNVTRTLTYGVK
jgi:hypothetical protein